MWKAAMMGWITVLFCQTILGAILSNPSNSASIPQVKLSAPGFLRFMLGDFEVTALYDGPAPLPPNKVFPNASNELIQDALTHGFIPSPVTTSINAFLINTGQHLVLIDTGVGGLFGKCCGLLVNNLRASGYQPEQIDLVFLTHFHSDHLGGAAANGQMTFPNAVLRASQAEADYWLNPVKPENQTVASWAEHLRQSQAGAQPYQTANQFQPFTGNEELVPGIRAASRLGHTPGHTPYFVESSGQTMVAWGDTTHMEALQLPHPEITASFDYSPDAARQARRDLLKLVAEKRYLVAGAHVAFPGIGHLRQGGGTCGDYVWVPFGYVSDPTVQRSANFSL